MRVPRLFHPGAASDARLRFENDAYHHVVRVLRRGAGDPLSVSDGRGRVFEAVVESVDDGAGVLVARLAGESPVQPPPLHRLSIAVGIPRGDAFEQALRNASELGVRTFQPLLTERTVARPRKGSQKLARWHRIALESAEQCQRAQPLELADPLTWAEFVDSQRDAQATPWIAVPGAAGPRASGFLDALEDSGGSLVTAVVGPEGGLAPGELTEASELGWRAVGFASPVLRTPTAVALIASVACLADEKD